MARISRVNGGRYKLVAKKVQPRNVVMPQELNPPLRKIEWSRDPYKTPPHWVPPQFVPTERITKEILESPKFGPPGFLYKDKYHLLAEVICCKRGYYLLDQRSRVF